MVNRSAASAYEAAGLGGWASSSARKAGPQRAGLVRQAFPTVVSGFVVVGHEDLASHIGKTAPAPMAQLRRGTNPSVVFALAVAPLLGWANRSV